MTILFCKGNEALHHLTLSGGNELLILMQTWDGVWKHAYYIGFYIGPKNDNYRLYLSEYSSSTGKSRNVAYTISSITKILNSEENSKWKAPNEMAKSKAQTYETKGQQLVNCHIPDLVQSLSHVENGGLNLVLKLAKLLKSNSIILTTMREQNKQTQ